MADTESVDVDVLLEQVWKDMHLQMKLLDEGQSVDLKDVDDKVRFFCDAVSKLPKDKIKQYEKKMAEIIEYLNKIVDKLTEQRQVVHNEIDMLNQRKKANVAYGGAAAMYNNDNEES